MHKDTTSKYTTSDKFALQSNHLLHPIKETFKHLDDRSREIMKKTIAFFEEKGLKRIKEDDHERVWYQDFIDFQKENKIFATLLTPPPYGEKECRFDSFRNYHFSEILGFYGLAYWYPWQVTMLGLGPIWSSKNEEIKKKTADLLKGGGIFAYGLSEKEHGADIMASEMNLEPLADGHYRVNGKKYYIGNANKAAFVSVFGKIKDTWKYVFFVVDSQHDNFNCIQNVTNSQNYVGEFELKDYPITDKQILSIGRPAMDASLDTVAYCKYNLGWAAIGMCTHAFYESINHAANRHLFGHAVTDFTHIKQYFVEAYARLVAMRLFSTRAADYMRAASVEDRRYLLYNPMVKMKVTMQGEEVMNLLLDVMAAKGFEKEPFFEMAIRDIRALPKLEGTAHINMGIVLTFMSVYLFEQVNFPSIERKRKEGNDEFILNQFSTTKHLRKVRFHSYLEILNDVSVANASIFRQQIETFKELVKKAEPSEEQKFDLDYMLILGELFTLIPYAHLIVESAKLDNLSDDILDQIFEFLVQDFSRYAVKLYSKSTCTKRQRELCMQLIREPARDDSRFNRLLNEIVMPLKGAYEINP